MGERISGQTYSERSDGWKKYWKVEDLWEVAEGLPIEYIPLQLLTDQLEGTCWTQGEEEDVTPQWVLGHTRRCLLYTSPSPRDGCRSRMPSSA